MRTVLNNFVVVEGPGGSGTTTLVASLRKKISDYNDNIVVYSQREPTDGSVGKLIRDMVTNVDASVYKTPSILANLFAADREDHVIKMRKILQQHENDYRHPIIISDRYYYSSYVYQYAQKEMTDNLNRTFPSPQVKILLTCDIDETMRRLGVRDGDVSSDDIFDRKDQIIKQTCLYKKIMLEDPEHNENVIHIDTTSNSIEEVTDIAFNYILNKIFKDRTKDLGEVLDDRN